MVRKTGVLLWRNHLQMASSTIHKYRMTEQYEDAPVSEANLGLPQLC